MLLRAWKWSEGPNSQDKTYRILKKRGPDSINKHTEMQQERYIFFTSHSVWKWQRKMEKNWVAALSDESEAEPWHRQTLCTVMGCWFQYMSVRLIQTTDKKKGWKLNDSLASKRKPYTLIQKLDFDKNIKYDKEHILLTIWLFLCSSESPNPMLVMSSFSKSKSSLFESHWDCL